MVNLSFMQVYNPKNVQTFNKPVLAGHMHKNEAKTKENQTVSKNINLKFKEIIFQADAFQILFKLFHFSPRFHACRPPKLVHCGGKIMRAHDRLTGI